MTTKTEVKCDICGGAGDVNCYPNDMKNDEMKPCKKCEGTGTIKTESRHTPTPCNIVELKNNEYEVFTPEWRSSPTCKAYSFEKAAFIVRAVNERQSHLDLIADLLSLVKGDDAARSSSWATDKIMKAERVASNGL